MKSQQSVKRYYIKLNPIVFLSLRVFLIALILLIILLASTLGNEKLTDNKIISFLGNTDIIILMVTLGISLLFYPLMFLIKSGRKLLKSFKPKTKSDIVSSGNAGWSKELDLKHLKLFKSLLLIKIIFFIFYSYNSHDYFVASFAIVYTVAFLGLIKKKRWSTISIMCMAALEIISYALAKTYIAILFPVVLFLLGLSAYKQFKGEASGSQIKIKATGGFKRDIFSFLVHAVQTIFLIAAFFLMIYTLIARPFQVGTGMEPTIKKGSYVASLLLPLRFINPGRQDIVSFINPENPEKDYISRVIGIPGDKIVLKDGYVYLNGKLLDEPYTLKPRSTWVYSKAILGQNCQEIVVPKNSFFVMGDNRVISPLSIYIGFISKDKIIGYVPHNLIRFLTYYPIDWSTHLRDTSHDKDLMSTSILDVNKYVELINQKRVASSIPPLKYDKKLELSADLRLQNMVKYNDFSSEATKSGYTRKKSFNDAGFNSGIILEQIIGGYDDSYYLFNGEWSLEGEKNLLNKSFQSIGIVSKVVDVNNCPNQVVVQHFWGQ